MIRSVIRGFILMFGLLLGLTLALITSANVSHLRALAPLIKTDLPDWTTGLTRTSGVSRGQHGDAHALFWPEAPPQATKTSLDWQFQRLTSSGILWQVNLAGGDISLRADLHLPYGGQPLTLTNLAGATDPAQLLALGQAGEIPASGQVEIRGWPVVIDPSE